MTASLTDRRVGIYPAFENTLLAKMPHQYCSQNLLIEDFRGSILKRLLKLAAENSLKSIRGSLKSQDGLSPTDLAIFDTAALCNNYGQGLNHVNNIASYEHNSQLFMLRLNTTPSLNMKKLPLLNVVYTCNDSCGHSIMNRFLASYDC